MLVNIIFFKAIRMDFLLTLHLQNYAIFAKILFCK